MRVAFRPQESDAKISVVIPTLQRPDDLEPLVKMCSEHPLVKEVLLVNNAQTDVSFTYAKLVVLQQDDNIFVNPAWNLAVRRAQAPYLAILNDDVSFDPELIDLACRLLARPTVGMVGIDGSFINRPREPRLQVRIATHEHVSLGFGMAMFMRRADYVPIPESMRIWGGDDWLFLQQRRLNRVICGARFETEVSVTSSSEEFQLLRTAEYVEIDKHLKRVAGKRWWHYPSRGLAALRSLRGRLRKV